MNLNLDNKKILILSEGFGTGHTKAAHALSVGLEQHDAELSTFVLELGSSLHPKLAPLIFSAFKKTISSRWKIYNRLYLFRHQKKYNRLTQFAIHKIFYAQTEKIINDIKPDMIICTHPFPNLVVSRMKRCGLTTPLFTLITDYDAHAAWISHEVNKYLVSTKQVMDKLVHLGINPRYIEVTGIPVHPDFFRTHNIENTRQKFHLKTIPTVMVMGGGWGLIGEDNQFKSLLKWCDQIQFIFCLGNNQKAMESMSNETRFRHPNIKLLGYTDDIDQLMDVSDILITKPGGMTCTEAIIKEIPMLLYDTISGQESNNLSFLISHGFGEKIESEETLELWFSRLVHHYSFIQERKMYLKQKKTDFCQSDCNQTIIHSLYSQIS